MESAHLTLLLLLGAYLALFFTFPVGNVFLAPTVVGLGGETLFGLSFAKVVIVLQVISLVHAFILLVRPERLNALLNIFRSKNFIPVFLGLLWAKVLYDCFDTGIDEVRSVSLRLGVAYSLMPLLMFLLYLPSQGSKKTIFSVLLGMIVYPVLFVLPAYQDLLAQIYAGARVVLYDQDTIRGALMIHFGVCGCLLLAFWSEHLSVKIICLSLALPGVALLLLNATRQFLLTIFILASYLAWIYSKKLALIVLPVLVVVAGFGLAFSPAAAERFSAQGLTTELETSRGEIWKGAFTTGMKHPLFGAGFRNYGDEVYLNTEEGPVFVKANAHGFIQDVFAEHGIPLFLFGLVSIGVAYFSQRGAWKFKGFQVLVGIAFSVSMPENFSAGATNSFGYHLLAVLPYAYALVAYEKSQAAKVELEEREMKKVREFRAALALEA